MNGMSTAEKSEEILRAILAIVNDGTGKRVGFAADWGGYTATISGSGKKHAHVGCLGAADGWERFVDDLHRQLTKGEGSWAAE